MKKQFYLFMGFTLSFCWSLFAQESRRIIGPEFWFASHDIKLESAGVGLGGSRIDAERDLDLDEKEVIPQFVFGIDFDEALVTFRGSDSQLKGRRTLNQSIDFSGISFPTSASVATEIDVFETSFTAESLVTRQNGDSWGWIFGVQYFSLETELRSQGQRVSDEFSTPWIMPGIKFQKALSQSINFDARAQFFALEINDKRFLNTDLGLLFDWQAGESINVNFGYRYFLLEGRNDDFDFDFKRFGPWFGLYMRF